MTNNSSLIFSWDFVWFRQKEPIKVQNFRLSAAHLKFHQICTLIGSSCWKYVKFQPKSIEDLSLIAMKIDAKCGGKLICCFKNDENFVNFHLRIRNSQNFYFQWFLLCKVYKTWPKKLQRSYILWHWRVMQIWKTGLWFWKWHDKYGRFSPEYLKVSELGIWWDPFIQSRKYSSLNFTEELCVMTMKNDVKFEEELTCRFKIDMRNLTNFDPSTRKSQKSAL